MGQPRHQGGASDVHLQAAAVAAAAQLAAGDDRGVADLARGPAGPPEQPPLVHDARADTGRGLEVDHLGAAPPGAPDGLGERTEVGVVVDPHGQAELTRELVGRHPAEPARQDAGAADGALGIQRRGDTEPDAEHVDAVRGQPEQQAVQNVRDSPDRLVGPVVHVEPVIVLGQHPVSEVSDDHPQVTTADVDADGQPGGRLEHDPGGRSPGDGPVGRAGVGNQPAATKAGEQPADRRTGQPDDRPQLGPGQRALGAQHVQDGPQRIRRAGGQRPELGGRHRGLQGGRQGGRQGRRRGGLRGGHGGQTVCDCARSVNA